MNLRLLHTLLFLAILAACRVSGQGKKQVPMPAHVDLYVSPLALIHSNPSLRFGVEVKPANRWSFGAAVGLGDDPTTQWLMQNDKRTAYVLREIRPEVKYYWHQWYDLAAYFSLEGIYSKTSYTNRDATYSHSSTEQIRFEKASFRKSKIAGLAKIGIKCLIGRKLSLDLYSGVGLARTVVRYSDLVNPTLESYDPISIIFEREDYYSGIHFMPQFVVGLKLGLSAWRR